MHLHARAATYAGDNPPPMCTPFAIMPRSDPARGVYDGMTFDRPPCDAPIAPGKTDDQVMRDTIAAMKRLHMRGVLSGEPDRVRLWSTAAPELFLEAVDYRLPGTKGQAHVAVRTIDELRRLHAEGRLAVIGEIMAQYEGVPPDDPRLEPLWALAEELDVPVAIHMGPGEPGQPYADGGYRVGLGDPLLLEPVLARHPRLRLSVMHAGYPMRDAMRALMFAYPQVYVDIGSIIYTEPRPAFLAFLRDLIDAGYGDRIMFGSDQMIWPGVIDAAVRTIDEAVFLDQRQKRNIFYNNAARFLRLTPAQIAEDHRR